MLWLAAALVALVSNLDNLAVGLGLGVGAKRVAALPNAVVALITMLGTAGAMILGQRLSYLVTPTLGLGLGSTVIASIGVLTLVEAIRTLRRSTAGDDARAGPPAGPPSLRPFHDTAISLPQALVLGVALAVNNVGVGVGAGVAGVPPLATTLLAGAFSAICLGGGARLGWSVAALLLGRWASLASGLLLVAFGIAMFTHLG